MLSFLLFLVLFLFLDLCCCVWAFSSYGKQVLLRSCFAQASHCGGFSCCGAQLLGPRASGVAEHGLSSCGLRALGLGLSSCGARAYLLHGMWNPPGPGMEPILLTLAGGFLSTGPPRKSREMVFWFGYPQKQTLRKGFETNSPFSS